MKKFASLFHIQGAKERTVHLPFSGNRAEKRSRNLGKAFGEVLGALKAQTKNISQKKTILKFSETSLYDL